MISDTGFINKFFEFVNTGDSIDINSELFKNFDNLINEDLEK